MYRSLYVDGPNEQMDTVNSIRVFPSPFPPNWGSPNPLRRETCDATLISRGASKVLPYNNLHGNEMKRAKLFKHLES